MYFYGSYFLSILNTWNSNLLIKFDIFVQNRDIFSDLMSLRRRIINFDVFKSITQDIKDNYR